MNPASIMKMMKAKKYIYGKSPKVYIILQYAFRRWHPGRFCYRDYSY